MRLRASIGGLGLGLLAACGGGGGGGGDPPVANKVRFALSSAEIPAGQDMAVITLRCDNLPENGPAVLMQATLDTGAALMVSNSRAPLEPIRSLPTLDGDDVGGTFRFVCGDARNTQAQALVVGDLCHVWLQVRSPRQPGTHGIALREVLVVDAAGNALPVDDAPMAASITVR